MLREENRRLRKQLADAVLELRIIANGDMGETYESLHKFLRKLDATSNQESEPPS